MSAQVIKTFNFVVSSLLATPRAGLDDDNKVMHV